MEMFDNNSQLYIWGKPNAAYQHKHLIPAVNHCGAGVMIQCFPVFTFFFFGHLHLQSLMSTNLNELKQSYREKLARLPPLKNVRD